MAIEISIECLHLQLIQEAFPKRLSDDDAMLLFCLLHLYEIELLPGVLNKTDNVVASAITQRHAGEVVASLFQDRKKKENDYRADYLYWYNQWGLWGGYEHTEQLSQEEQEKFASLKLQLESHPWVHEAREED